MNAGFYAARDNGSYRNGTKTGAPEMGISISSLASPVFQAEEAMHRPLQDCTLSLVTLIPCET